MSHQTPIATGMPNITVMIRRKFSANSGGMGTAMLISRLKMQLTTRKPAKIRIDVRAHDRSRISPTEVQTPMTAKAAHIAAPAITNWGVLGGCGRGATVNSDAIARTANSSMMMLPNAATIALTVMPIGLFMRIIYPLIFSMISR